MSRALSAFVLGLAATTPGIALASPWVLPRGTMALDLAFNYQLADEEYFESGDARLFPLRGRYDAVSFRAAARVGVTDRFELELGLPVTLVSYQSDAVLLLPRPEGSLESELDYYQRNIIPLARTAAGLGDLTVTGRWQWLLEPLAMATELRVKAPTGYDPPQGTFGDRPKSAEEFLAEAGRFVSPDNIRDDVTLGDGQLDLTLSMLFGWASAHGTFVRLDAGYNFRFGGAGSQVVGALRAGQILGDGLLPYVGVQVARTVTEGEIIGVSVAAIDPSLPADQYAGTNNLLLREVRLERDLVELEAGLIVRLSPEAELNFGYQRVLWGRNTAAASGVSLGLGLRTDLDAAATGAE
ncbi:hypothetical protein L6R52_01090 [Myxococcota bacterium]|nr:hypothetical protein [Myxococcota bacterium]